MKRWIREMIKKHFGLVEPPIEVKLYCPRCGQAEVTLSGRITGAELLSIVSTRFSTNCPVCNYEIVGYTTTSGDIVAEDLIEKL